MSAAMQAVGIARNRRSARDGANNGQYRTQGVERFANVLAGDGMELHDVPLGRGKVATFFQDVIGYSDFSQDRAGSRPV